MKSDVNQSSGKVQDGMDETLKSARSVHLVLIGVCAAIGVFAASPRETDKYAAAKTELEALRDVNFADFTRYAKSLIVSRCASLPWLQPQTLFPNGRITAPLSPLEILPFRVDESAANRLGDGAPLDDWFKFFDAAHPVVVYTPDEDDLVFKKFCQEIAEFARSTSQPELQTLSFKSGADGDAPSPLPAYAVCSGAGSPAAPVFVETIPAFETLLSRDAFRPWLAAAESARRLREISAPADPWLDRLRTVRNEIGGMKIADAAQYLETRVSSQTRKINVLGATVEERLTVVAAPLAALLTLLYLFLITRHLTAMPKTAIAEARGFPWVCLFPGLLARSVAYASAFLPLAVCLWLLWTSRTYSSVASMVTALVVIIALAAGAIGTGHQLFCLRKRLQKSV